MHSLNVLGIMKVVGWVPVKGSGPQLKYTALRVLQPDALRSKPLTPVQPRLTPGSNRQKPPKSAVEASESCTSGVRESCTQENTKSTSQNSKNNQPRYSDSPNTKIVFGPDVKNLPDYYDQTDEEELAAWMQAENEQGELPPWDEDEEAEFTAWSRAEDEKEEAEQPELQPSDEPQPLTNIRILNALSRHYEPDVASSLYGWTIERTRCARTRNPGLQIKYVAYVLKAAENFFLHDDSMQQAVLTYYDFAGDNGYVFDSRTYTWSFSLGRLAEHDLQTRMDKAEQDGSDTIKLQPTIKLLRCRAREHGLPCDRKSVERIVRCASDSLGFTETKA